MNYLDEKGGKTGEKKTGRSGETEEKIRPKVKTNDLPLFYFVNFFNPFDLIFF